MIFVVGEEVRKNRERISEARTQHSTITGIETYLATTRKLKAYKYVFGTTLLSLNESSTLNQKLKFTSVFVLKAQVEEMDIVEQDRNTLMETMKTVENQRDDLLRKGRVVESERNDFLRSNKLMEVQRDDLEKRCAILQKTNTTLNSRVRRQTICGVQ